ncbi:MAG: DUF4298 domain-containing protein [Candidatus Riflebacteria bacterium]|jgi:hypothetical protein|nr:DUF4298 domain-containing protein [Candidatus Riflebacteria bacterium]
MTAQIDRIKRMEKLLSESKEALKNLNEAIDYYMNLQPAIKELQYYYENGGWLKDFKDDEAGLLPKDLKRGVLSEDELYTFLEENDEIKAKIRM